MGDRSENFQRGEPVRSSILSRSIPPVKLETLDDALAVVGDFSKYQYFLLLGLLPYIFGYGALYFSQFFFTLTPNEFWCKVDELAEKNFTTEEITRLAIPASDIFPGYDTCRKKDLDFSDDRFNRNSINDSSLWSTNETVACDSWGYDISETKYESIGVELNWVCENSYLVSTTQAIFFCGSAVGGFLFGWLADYKGRVTALTILCAVGFLGSCLTAFSGSLLTFSLSRFVTGMAFDNIMNIPLIIVFEYITPNKRSWVVNIAFGTYFAASTTGLPWVAYFARDWRLFCMITSLPLLVGIFSPFILPESARWCISKQKFAKVINKLKRIAAVNKKTPDREFYEKFQKQLNQSQSEPESASVIDILKKPRLAKNTLICATLWFLTMVVFDGHVYSLKLLESSIFVSFSLACLTELPAGFLLLLMVDRWGRKFCTFMAMGLTTVCSIGELLLPFEHGKLAMSISSRFLLNMAANVELQYAAELLPTPVRAQATAVIHTLGFLGHAAAPYINISANIWHGLPLLIIATVSLTSTILVCFLPETLGQEIPQTLEDGQNLGKDQSTWSFLCRKKTKSNRENNAG